MQSSRLYASAFPSQQWPYPIEPTISTPIEFCVLSVVYIQAFQFKVHRNDNHNNYDVSVSIRRRLSLSSAEY